MWQERILLRLIKAMRLINKQDGIFSIDVSILLRLVYRGTDILDPAEHSGDCQELGMT